MNTGKSLVDGAKGPKSADEHSASTHPTNTDWPNKASSADLHIDRIEPPEKYNETLAKIKESIDVDDRKYDEIRGQARKIVLAIDAPPNWAMLCFSSPCLGHLQIHAVSQRECLPCTDKFKSPEIPGITHETLKSTSLPAQSILDDIASYSNEDVPKDLRDWFIELLKETHNLVVTIIEVAPSNMAWELIKIKGNYLGACAEFSRWILPRHEGEALYLQPPTRTTSGSVFSLLTPSLSRNSNTSSAENGKPAEWAIERIEDTEQKEINKIKEHIKELKSGSSNDGRLGFDVFRHTVSTGQTNSYCLIYIGCHGFFGPDANNKHLNHYLSLNEDIRAPNQFRASELSNLSYPNHDAPVVFANACESGRLRPKLSDKFRLTLVKDHQKLKFTGSLPMKFLAHISQGYIGTLTDVRSLAAEQIGSHILRKIRESIDGIAIPEVLLSIRQHAAANYPTNHMPSSEKERAEQQLAAEKLLYAFCYVYYGSPFLKVQLKATNSPDQSPA